MTNTELIGAIIQLRKLITVLDSLGLPLHTIQSDMELSKSITKNLNRQIIDAAKAIHITLQRIEKSKRYGSIVSTIRENRER